MYYVLLCKSEYDSHVNKELLLVPDDVYHQLDTLAQEFFLTYDHGETAEHHRRNTLELEVYGNNEGKMLAAWHEIQDEHYKILQEIEAWREQQPWYATDILPKNYATDWWKSHFAKWLTLHNSDVQIVSYTQFNEARYAPFHYGNEMYEFLGIPSPYVRNG